MTPAAPSMLSAAVSLLAVVAAPSPRAPGGLAGTPPPPDIRGIVPPQPYTIYGSPVWLVLALVFALLAGLVAWYLFTRRPAPKLGPVATPREVAERRLRELAQRVGSLDARTFGNEVADVLRVYIGGQFGLHPERQTSQEFLSSLSGARAFTKTERILLTDFLEGCDLLKFARADATLDRKQDLLAQASEFVASSAPPALPDPSATLPTIRTKVHARTSL